MQVLTILLTYNITIFKYFLNIKTFKIEYKHYKEKTYLSNHISYQYIFKKLLNQIKTIL